MHPELASRLVKNYAKMICIGEGLWTLELLEKFSQKADLYCRLKAM